MSRRSAIRRLRRRAARGHPVWWVLAGIVLGVAGMAAALWRDGDDELERAFGVRLPGYLSRLFDGPSASLPPSTSASRPHASSN